ncbi:hypothetical protein F0P96_09220 [Hymenobacter busanensis]|uniref:Uncharacterized protein n=1 Tax=Hymenobacter busanensis TaxID=2607656 RepID=A0A7L4ZXD9_9BACT|nr:hypothetical protein [Hymenobacter busanensis]KAA9333151.1 hypothetical protein F0P96_09220 [Hymenobacter busanensis]QHJ08174.1 hypothetical protein GUY19_13105 [Hymenobacter busanensis]
MRYATSTLLGLLCLLLVSVGCKKEDAPVPVSFDVEDSWQALVELNPYAPTTMYLPAQRIYSTCAVTCSRNETSIEKLQSASLSGVELTLKPSQAPNFDFLQQVTIYLISEQGAQSVLASLDQIPAGATTLTLKPTDQSMLAFLRNGSYIIKPYLELKAPTQSFASLQMKLRFRAQAHKL